MSIPLKYLLPLLIFFISSFLVSIQTYIHNKHEYDRAIQYATSQAKVVGNRIASRITYELKSGSFTQERMTSQTAPYMTDTLNHVSIYDNNFNELFTGHIPSYQPGKNDAFNPVSANKIKEHKFSDVSYNHENYHVVGYFPLDLKEDKGEVQSRKTGVLHLVFDATQYYIDAREQVITTAIVNLILVIIMVTLFSTMMYFFVFKRLGELHNATKKMLAGDFDVHVKSRHHDELSDVIDTFNHMAVEIKTYIYEMESKVKEAVLEQTEQSKILIQQSRMASMGEMIGNIAHQWRQPLNALSLIIQKLKLLSDRGKLDTVQIDTNVEKASHIIQNMSETIDDFRDFFRPDKTKEHFDLKEVVHDVLVLLEAGLKNAQITIHVNIDQPKCEIYGFKNEFSQVIVNLINNAKDALIENNIQNKEINIVGKSKPDEVVFTISDNAGGIPNAVIDRIFEPYFTTKEEGKGTGIGLYMSKMIIETNMHGIIKVSNTKKGAKFSMIFKSKGKDFS